MSDPGGQGAATPSSGSKKVAGSQRGRSSLRGTYKSTPFERFCPRRSEIYMSVARGLAGGKSQSPTFWGTKWFALF